MNDLILGIIFIENSEEKLLIQAQAFLKRLDELHLLTYIDSGIQRGDDDVPQYFFRLQQKWASEWAPAFNTFNLSKHLHLDPDQTDDLEREILIALLVSPIPWVYDSFEALASCIRVRQEIVVASKRTVLDFKTSEAERPNDCWVYDEKRGFTLIPGTSLIDALIKATQPEVSGTHFSFSCYRATEYIILLSIAKEASRHNQSLFNQLQSQWETKAIMSGRFHEVFLVEYGSMSKPLPIEYYIPGDRIWFRNPDDRSSNVEGYEGSWVFYLGGGLFPNFWKASRPYSLQEKCLEIYHWRHGVQMKANGELVMDENLVSKHVTESRNNPEELEAIMNQMQRYRDPKGVYEGGGCMDTTRESPRTVLPSEQMVQLP